jgi:hypothetical protein
MAKKELAAFGGKITLSDRVDDGGLGSNNVTSDVVAQPQLKLLQLISDELKPGTATYIKEARAGMFINTATNQLHESVYCMNLWFSRSFNVWQTKDNILLASFECKPADDPAEIEAKGHAFIEDNGLSKDIHQVTESHDHTLLLLDDEGTPLGTAIMYLSKTKIKISKLWNAQIMEYQKKGKARFSYIWQLTSHIEKKGSYEYYNFMPELFKVGDKPIEVPDALYNAAKEQILTVIGDSTKAAA